MRALLCAALVLLAGGAIPGHAQQGDRWQVTLHDGRLMWDLRLVRLTGDTLVLRQGTGDSTYRFPIGRVDELRLVHKAERRLRGEPRGYGSVLAGTDDEMYRLTLYSVSERRQIIERVFKDHPPDGASSDLWQITLRDGTIVWNLHLVGLVRDTIVFQQDDKTVRYPSRAWTKCGWYGQGSTRSARSPPEAATTAPRTGRPTSCTSSPCSISRSAGR